MLGLGDGAIRKLKLTEAQESSLHGYRELPTPRPPEGVYKAAPRDGVWATPPFLHNGSVPNLYEMLIPAAERTKKFYLGGDFDPVKVGIRHHGDVGDFPDGYDAARELKRRSLFPGWPARQRRCWPLADRRSALGARRISEIHSRSNPAA